MQAFSSHSQGAGRLQAQHCTHSRLHRPVAPLRHCGVSQGWSGAGSAVVRTVAASTTPLTPAAALGAGSLKPLSPCKFPYSSKSSSRSLLGQCERGGRGNACGRLCAVSSLAAPPAVTQTAVDDKVWVPFKPDFYSSQPVQIQGSFNDWSAPFPLNHDPETGKVGGVVQLEARHGVVCFKYQVGDKWFLSREDAAAADNQGCINNTTAGRQTVTFKFPGAIIPPSTAAPGYEVHVAGSFTDWQVSIPLTLGPDGDYYAKVALTPGHHTFKFLLDAMSGVDASSSSSGSSGLPISLVPSGPRSPQVERRARWVVVDWLPVETVPGGMQVNSLNVPPPPTFKVLYHTDFKEAYIHYRLKGQAEFQRARMYHQPDCMGLMVAQLPAPDMSCQLEFSITGARSYDPTATSTIPSSSSDEDSDVWTAAHLGSSSSNGSSGGSSGSSQQQVVRDPPVLSELYTAVHPGVWRVKDQQLNLDAAGQLPPLMLCTDLDGTLIEDGEESDFVRTADASTRKAAAYFGQYLAPSGGVLVFNTGRSIGMVEGLLAKKAGVMPRPHAIITAVGTKVFLWDVATESWLQDPNYALLLNDGWNGDTVSSMATDLRHRYNGQVAVVDDGTEHPHRLSLTMRSDIADRVTKKWSEGLQQSGVKHQMVASIGGDWRYVDCISAHAGKGRAMLYVASRYGITTGDAVAAGDSGNDLLMLGPVDGAYHPAIVMSNSHPEVWEWLNKLSPSEKTWVYTPKGERAAGLVEGMKAIVAEKLRARSLALQQQLQQQKQRQASAQPGGGVSSSGGPTRTVRVVRS